MTRRARLLLVAAAVGVAACAGPVEESGAAVDALARHLDAVRVRISGTAGPSEGCFLLAADAGSRRQGLMGVDDLGRYDGMVFRWEQPTAGSFWMYRTVMGLTVAFVAGGEVIDTVDMVPCPEADSSRCPLYGAAGAYDSAVEVPVGTAAALGLVTGSTVAVVGGC